MVNNVRNKSSDCVAKIDLEYVSSGEIKEMAKKKQLCLGRKSLIRVYAFLKRGDLGKQTGMSEMAHLLFTKPALVLGVFACEKMA